MADYILFNDGELMHYGVKGMKWGVRKKYKTGDKLDDDPNDSKVTRRVKKDYNSMTDDEFRGKYQTSKNTYRKRVNRYGDPYMNSPMAKFGKRKGQKIVDKAVRENKDIEKSLQSLELHKNGIVGKNGKTLLSAKDIKATIRDLNEVKLNNITKIDSYASGYNETNRAAKELSKSYDVYYDVVDGKYKLVNKT